jgi:N-acetylmuramoyl-L-alanine amidase
MKGSEGRDSVFIRATSLFSCWLGVALLTGLGPAAPVATAAIAAPDAAGALPVATDFRIGGNDSRTRFVVDLSKKVDLRAFTLADPYRVVIDLPQLTFKLPANAGEHGLGLIKAFRYGLIMIGGSRIVLDTKGPVRVDKAFTLAAGESQPARLVLELSATDRESFLRTIAIANSLASNVAGKDANAAPQKDNDPRPLIVLDPGHGGIDSGTRSHDGKIDEKDIVLAFALTLRAKLESSGKYRVAMTRSTDVFLPLEERVHFARARHAALFISIHCDALPSSEGRTAGATVYTLSKKASDSAAAHLAQKENESDMVAGVDLSNQPNDVASILFDLAQRATKTFSVQFARDLVGTFRGTVGLHDPAIKSASFVVLKDPDVPSVLVELGYLTAKADVKNLTSPAWRSRTASALAEAINRFFAPQLAGTAAASAPVNGP